MVTDLQVRRLFGMRNKHDYLYQAADAAGMSDKTARKYLKTAPCPASAVLNTPGPRGRIRSPMTGHLLS